MAYPINMGQSMAQQVLASADGSCQVSRGTRGKCAVIDLYPANDYNSDVVMHDEDCCFSQHCSVIIFDSTLLPDMILFELGLNDLNVSFVIPLQYSGFQCQFWVPEYLVLYCIHLVSQV